MCSSVAGYEFPARQVTWLTRDVLLFAASIGVRADDLHFLYENHPNFCAFPTYPLMLPFKHADQEVVEFYARNAMNNPPVGPRLDWRYVVDGQRELTILEPFSTTSTGRQFELRNKIIGLYDKGKPGTAYATEQLIVDKESGKAYTKIVTTYFLPGQGGWGGPRGPFAPSFESPARKPDAEYTVQTADETVYLHRLNGDYNPLHSSPEADEKIGTAYYGVLRTCCGSDGSRLRNLQARFASPVRTGDRLITEIWKLGRVGDVGEIRFITRTSSGRPVLPNGRALLLPTEKEARLQFCTTAKPTSVLKFI
ncbi:HotDog domain-containing protein [Aspergillus venezuelensis]